MQYTILIAGAFLLATIAVATLSPFDNLPQRAPRQETTTIAPTEPEPPGAHAQDDESTAAESHDEGEEAGSGDEDGSNDQPAAKTAEDDESAADESDGEESKKTASAEPEPAGAESSDTSGGDVDEEPVGEYYGEENPDASDDD